jgi:hypothetical protein
VSEDNIELKNHDSEHDATERGSERTARDSSGELSGGRRDRSREMLREELERNLDDATRRSGGKRDWEPPDRSARAAREATADKPKAKDGEAETAGAATTAGGQVDTSVAPKSWRADERAHYDQLPPEIKHAIHRREQESERGVAELKNRYAELDAALAPSMEVIKSHGHTAGTAVRRMFDWWNALANRPARNASPRFLASAARSSSNPTPTNNRRSSGSRRKSTRGSVPMSPRCSSTFSPRKKPALRKFWRSGARTNRTTPGSGRGCRRSSSPINMEFR